MVTGNIEMAYPRKKKTPLERNKQVQEDIIRKYFEEEVNSKLKNKSIYQAH